MQPGRTVVAAVCLLAGTAGEVSARGGGAVFRPAVHLPTGAGPTDVSAGFLDRDQHVDLVVANNRARTLTVLLGNGDGTFREPAIQTTPGGPPIVSQPDTRDTAPVTAVIGRMDGDEIPDLVVVFDKASEVAVYLGNGDGTFTERSSTENPRVRVGPAPQDAVLADLDFDGQLDVATANAFDDSVSVLPGNGDGTLLAEDARRVFAVGTGPCGLDSGDLNGDGYEDLAVSLTVDNGVVPMLNRGILDDEQRVDFRGYCYGDCNGDADVTVDELVRGVNNALENPNVPFCDAFDTDGSGTVTVDELVRAVNSSLNRCPFTRLPTDAIPAGLLLRDIDADQIPDLLVAMDGSERISVFNGRGDGIFNVPEEFSIGRSSRGLAVADLDRDGRLDLIATTPVDDLVSLLFGSTEGGVFSLGRLQSVAVHDAPSGGLNCAGVAVADLNGDGFPDVITANEASDDISILINDAGAAR